MMEPDSECLAVRDGGYFSLSFPDDRPSSAMITPPIASHTRLENLDTPDRRRVLPMPLRLAISQVQGTKLQVQLPRGGRRGRRRSRRWWRRWEIAR